jgi:hypothetical protein
MSSGGRRGGGDDESEDEGYEVEELRDSGKLSWKRHLALFRRELSFGSGLGRDASRTGSRWDRFIIHPDKWYVYMHHLFLSLSHSLLVCGSLRPLILCTSYMSVDKCPSLFFFFFFFFLILFLIF